MDLSSLHAWGQRGRVSARSFDGRPLGDLHRGSWWLPQAMWAKTPPALGLDRPTGVACCGEGHRDDGVGGPERGSRRRRGAIPRGQQRLSSNACGARPPCATQAGSSRGGRGGPLSVGAGGHVPSGRWPPHPAHPVAPHDDIRRPATTTCGEEGGSPVACSQVEHRSRLVHRRPGSRRRGGHRLGHRGHPQQRHLLRLSHQGDRRDQVINYPKVKCVKGEKLIHRSQQAPAGPQGPQGEQGPKGDPGPADWYAIQDKPAGFADGVDNGDTTRSSSPPPSGRFPT